MFGPCHVEACHFDIAEWPGAAINIVDGDDKIIYIRGY